MNKIFQGARDKLYWLRYYSRVFRWRDAVSILFCGKSTKTIKVYVSKLQRFIFIRLGTTDLDVIRQVLDGYQSARLSSAKAKLIIDAGANIGASSLYFANLFPEAKIYAIEPEGSNFAVLQRNCSGLENIIVRNAALWYRTTCLTLKDENAEKWAFSVTEGRISSNAMPSVTIEELLEESGQEVVDILKIDIEGAEKDLFSVGYEKWLPRVRLLIIELHDRFVPGCSYAVYSALCEHKFSQQISGENVYITLESTENSRS